MSRITLRLPVSLRGVTGGAEDVTVTAADASTLADVLAAADVVSLFLDDTDIRSGDGLETPVRDGAVVYVVQAVAGGSAFDR